MAVKILANHAHVFQETVRPHATVEKLLEMMDNCGIDQAVCFAPFWDQTDRDPGEGIHNRWLAEKIADNERLYGFGTLDFTKDNLREQVMQIRELGLRGIKIHPAHQKLNVLSDKAMEVYRAAVDCKLFLTIHTGAHWHRLKDYDVLLFDEVSYHFPDLQFSMEHIGGYSFFNEAMAVIFNNRKIGNVYGGLTSNFTKHKSRAYYLSDDKLEELVAQVKAHKLIFGLDFPYNREQETLIALGALQSLPLTEEEYGLIVGGNLRRVLGLA